MKTKNKSAIWILMQFKPSLIISAIALLLIPSFAAWAGGTVTNCTETDLRSAMAGGGTVTFACDGTITLASTITNSLNTILDGSGHQVTISGGNAVRVIEIGTNVSLKIVNLIIANGLSTNGGGIYIAGGTISAINCVFIGNVAQGRTNGLTSGGAIRNEGWLELNSCTFTSNRALAASGTSCITPPAGPPDDPFPGQDAFGGAIHNLGNLRVNLCTFTQNAALAGSGGLGCDGRQGMSGFPGGAGGSAYGGAICNLGNLSVSQCAFTSNAVAGGTGGIGGTGGYAWFSTGGTGGAGGGGGAGNGSAIFNGGSATLTSSTVVSNTVAGGAGGGGGGGGYATSDMVLPGTGGLGGNGGSGRGVVCGSAVGVVNCTLARNIGAGGVGGSGGHGGGAVLPKYHDGRGGTGGAGADGFGGVWSCTAVNCTLAFNSGNGGNGGTGGGGYPVGANGINGSAGGAVFSCTLTNTLLATNSPGGNGAGGLTDAGHNLSSDNTCNFTSAGSLNNIDPKLGPLANNGGPTLTMALLPGSPAIDAGDNAAAPPLDQRGFPRPAGVTDDIGAFEYGSMLPILFIIRTGETGLDITAGGNAGQSCRLLASTDLTNWVPIATNQIAGDGIALFHDNCGLAGDCRFYRLVMP